MSLNAAVMEKVLDPYWNEVIQETDEFSDSFWQRCEKLDTKNANVLGEKWKVRTGYNRSESWANFDGQAYAQGGNSEFQNLFVPYRTVSTTGLLTKAAIDNDDGKSQYHPLVGEMNATLMSGMKQLNRHSLMGNGTARIAVLTAAYSGGSPTVLTCAPGTDFGNKGAQFIEPGKKVQICDPTGTTVRTATIGGEGVLTVSAVNYATGAITFTSAAPSDAADDDIIVPERSAGRGMHGVQYWVANSGNLFELSRSTYAGLKSVMADGSSGALLLVVETMFSKMAHYIEEDVALGLNEEKGNHEFFWSPTQREKYRKECIGLGITMLGAGKIDAGYGHKEEVNGYTFTVQKDHDNTKIHCLRMKDWYRIVRGEAEKPFEVIPIHGQKYYNLYDSEGRVTSGLAFTLGGYVNLACRNVRQQAAIYSLPTSGLSTGNE